MTADSAEVSIRPGTPRIERTRLLERFGDKISMNEEFNRSLVSFQANKTVPVYRWFRYKEAFSSHLVSCLLDRYPTTDSPPRILDPFAGVGTTLTTAARRGWEATGIELLPVGVEAINARIAADRVSESDFSRWVNGLEKHTMVNSTNNQFHIGDLGIARGAYPPETERDICTFMDYVAQIPVPEVSQLFKYACLSILEEVSYARKDGQYLRWDPRSGRSRARFQKGNLPSFSSAIRRQLGIMTEDLGKRSEGLMSSKIRIIAGSCLDELPLLKDSDYNLVITSPPYCNRYDYTRTYALELAFLQYTDKEVKELRQTLLSATVENKSKRDQLRDCYKFHGKEEDYFEACRAFDGQAALHEVLTILYDARRQGLLNNSNIPCMVENYFFEMNVVIRELARVLKPGGRVIMVNDNVRYQGEEIPVDLILSDFAEAAGLDVEHIWVLRRGKGNSSQQMRSFGRKEIRKGIYVWYKPETTERS